MHQHIAWVLVLAACGPREVVTVVERACGDAGVEDAGIEDGGVELIDAGVELTDAGPAPDDGCPEGFVPDGKFCVTWSPASAPQACLDGSPALEHSDFVPPWTEHALLAITCAGELHQLYHPYGDHWERARDVTTVPIEPLALGPDDPPLIAAATLPDGMRVGVAGSFHAAPPYETWIAEPGGRVWRRSIDAPTIWVTGAGAVTDDMVLFAGSEAFLFVRLPRRL